MGLLIRLILCCIGVVLAGCSTTPKGPLSLDEQLVHPSTIRLDLIRSDTPHLIVEGHMPDGKLARFIIDTGATLTTIYPDLQQRLGLEVEAQSAIRVHGMSSAKLFPSTQISGMSFDGKLIPPKRIVIIPRDGGAAIDRIRASDSDGILGMDILKDYSLFLTEVKDHVYFIPAALGVPQLPQNWNRVALESNPFLDDGRDLHFFQLRFGNGLTPALLDTGSQFNMMNWNTKRFPRLRAVKRNLRKQWEISGAVGVFSPVSKVTATNSRAGQKYWSKSDFLVLDFKTLNILGIDGRPFVISGLPMLKDNAVLVDFENNQMYFSPGEDEIQPEPFLVVR